MFCQNCGKQIPNDSLFCPSCGVRCALPVQTAEPVRTAFAAQPQYQQPATRPQPVNAPVNGIAPGYSDKIYDSAITAKLKKNKNASRTFFLIMILLPVAIGAGISLSKDDKEFLVGGAFISLVFLVVNLVSLAKQKTARQWDGTVVNKYEERSKRSSDSRGNSEQYYVVEFRTDVAATRKVKETAATRCFFDYLQIGDRVRFHPQFNSYYEKYDKSHDTFTICPLCMRKIDLAKDYCDRCKIPVIK